MKYFIALLIDVMVLLSFVLGELYDSSAFMGVGYFWGWLVGVIGVLGFISPSVRQKAESTYEHQPLLFRIYDVVTDLAFIMFAAYQGWFVLATVYTLHSMMKAQHKQKMEKLCRE